MTINELTITNLFAGIYSHIIVELTPVNNSRFGVYLDITINNTFARLQWDKNEQACKVLGSSIEEFYVSDLIDGQSIINLLDYYGCYNP